MAPLRIMIRLLDRLLARLPAPIFSAPLPPQPPPPPRCPADSSLWSDNLQNAWAALRMIREAVEEFGQVASLESPEAVLLRGPEPVHEAEAIVEALGRIRTALDNGDE